MKRSKPYTGDEDYTPAPNANLKRVTGPVRYDWERVHRLASLVLHRYAGVHGAPAPVSTAQLSSMMIGHSIRISDTPWSSGQHELTISALPPHYLLVKYLTRQARDKQLPRYLVAEKRSPRPRLYGDHYYWRTR